METVTFQLGWITYRVWGQYGWESIKQCTRWFNFNLCREQRRNWAMIRELTFSPEIVELLYCFPVPKYSITPATIILYFLMLRKSWPIVKKKTIRDLTIPCWSSLLLARSAGKATRVSIAIGEGVLISRCEF